jgi:predicted ATP-grasp superfamily ATP-dependent carboligase
VRILIVEDGRAPYVLAAARSLARAGHHVGLASSTEHSRGQASRSVRAWHRVTPPEEALGLFLSDVAAACRAGGYDMVFAADDIETLALSAGREVLPVAVPLAPHQQVLRSIDKLSLTAAASGVGLAVPETTRPGDEPWGSLRYPLVVKSRLHWTPGAGSSPRHLVRQFAGDQATAQRHVAHIEACGGAALLQEVVTGRQIAMSLVVDDAGEIRAVSQQRTEVQADDGTSIRASTTQIDRELMTKLQRLLAELGWTGLANVQFLVGPDGVARLTDFNGRFYGSLALAIAAGADLPAVWVQVVLGQDTGPCQVARPGVRFTSFERDLQRVRRLDAHRSRQLAGAARFAVGAVHQTWSVADPMPTAVALAQAGARAAARANLVARVARAAEPVRRDGVERLATHGWHRASAVPPADPWP